MDRNRLRERRDAHARVSRQESNGKVPVLEIEPGVYLPESNAIICYLADESALMPSDRLSRARVLAWLFFEQYSHEPYIAVARFLCRFHPDPSSQRALAESKLPGGYRALEVMEKELGKEPFLVGRRYTVADIALYKTKAWVMPISQCTDTLVGGQVCFQPLFLSRTGSIS